MCYRVYLQEYEGTGSIYDLKGNYLEDCRYFIKKYEEYMNPRISTGLRGFDGWIDAELPLRIPFRLVLENGKKINVFQMVVGATNEFIFGNKLK